MTARLPVGRHDRRRRSRKPGRYYDLWATFGAVALSVIMLLAVCVWAMSIR